jgi:hypothetical protein
MSALAGACALALVLAACGGTTTATVAPARPSTHTGPPAEEEMGSSRVVNVYNPGTRDGTDPSRLVAVQEETGCQVAPLHTSDKIT